MTKLPPLEAIIASQPHLYAEYCSEGVWKPWPYLELISDVITDAVANGNGRVIVNMPPQHGKSLFISKWVPTWFLSKYPTKRIILATYEASFAASWGRAVRDEALHNERVKLNVRQDVKASNAWMTREGGGMMTAGVGGPITGKGGDLLIIDDPVKNWDEAKSPVYQQRNIDWFNSTFYTRRQPGTSIVMLMTRWHENDLGGYLLNQHSDEWTHICIPALSEGDDVLGREEGEALCPDRFDEDNLKQTKEAVGPIVWSGLYQQRPTALEGGLIKRDWIGHHDYSWRDIDYEEWIQSWDLSFKKTEEGSYVVGQVWAKLGAQYYLMEQIRRRMDFPETKQAIRAMSQKYPKAIRKFVEDKANGPAIIDDLRKEVPGLIAYKDNSSKEARLSAVSGLFEAGNIFIPRVSDRTWVTEYIEELVNFPNSINDDQVDATSQALLNLNKASFDHPFITSGGIGSKVQSEFY